MREEEVGRMRDEIVVLRKAVAEAGTGAGRVEGPGADGVPRETYENLKREKEELEEVVKQKEKRLMRLKSVCLIPIDSVIELLHIKPNPLVCQVFQSKAVEFRDSISSLLGYKLHFEPKHVRLTSVYDRDIDLKFASGGGNQAVMGVSSAFLHARVILTSTSANPNWWWPEQGRYRGTGAGTQDNLGGPKTERSLLFSKFDYVRVRACGDGAQRLGRAGWVVPYVWSWHL